MKKIKELYLSTYFLIDFDFIKTNPVIKNFLSFLKNLSNSSDIEKILESYAVFVNSLKNKSFSSYLKTALLEGKRVNNEKEFEIISNLSKITFLDIKKVLIEKFPDFSMLLENLPVFENSLIEPCDISVSSCDSHRTFLFDKNFDLVPVDFFETTKFCDLKGYVEQKKILYKNTAALINGLKVNNILLYGDAGCGKSTSVRALLNEFSELKMVQIFKDNLINLDKLYAKLKNLPSKFIIFADDISFDETDKSLSTMKAVLEGSIVQCPLNAAIYATSNRRHLVRESFQSRTGDEIHLQDTINEISSLSERFGINILFQRPTNDEFIDIVLKLASDNNIKMDEQELILRAQKLALVKGSKSPRIARQLIDNLLNGVEV